MADYWVDDGGDNTTGASWATAYSSVGAAQTAGVLLSGNRIFIGDDHNDPNVVAHKEYVGPTTGLPVIFISADRADAGAVPAYKVGTGAQLSSLGGAYNITLNGAFALYGVRIESGAKLTLTPDDNETISMQNCKIVIGANGTLEAGNAAAGYVQLKNIIIDLTADGTTARTASVFDGLSSIRLQASGITFVNPSYRTGNVFGQFTNNGDFEVTGADISGFVHATLCEVASASSLAGRVTLANIKTTAAQIAAPIATGTMRSSGQILITNCGPADAPEQLFLQNAFGTIASSAAVYRTGGAEIEGIPVGWSVLTTAVCGEATPLYSPWIYGVTTAGSRTLSVFVTNDTADFFDDEVWLEAEYMATSDSPLWSSATDHRVINATHTTSPNAVARADTTSAWVGGASGFDTYKQKLQVPVTIGETGMYRVRVCTGVTSLASTRDFYIDPRVVVG